MPAPHDLDHAPTLDAGSDEARESHPSVVVSMPEELAAGTLLTGRFAIDRAIGAGGMGTVYVARDQTLGRDVAIKLHHAAGGATRLRREAVAMARLAHPNVVTVFEVGELDRRPFVVMEYVPGHTLRGWLAAKPRTWRETLAILIAAGEGLAAAHAGGLVHRDFKPENVLIGRDGRARVGDFGLARELDSKDDEPAVRVTTGEVLAPMTQTGAVLGTPAYMAPEQLAGTADARSDQFAFCVTAWEALYGMRPFPGATIELVHAAIAAGTLVPPMSSSQIPTRLRVVLERGLAKDPGARYPSVAALLDAMRPRPLRKRWLVLGGAGLAAAVAAIAIVSRSDDAREMCGRASELTAGVWDGSRRAAVADRFARSGRAEAAATFQRVAERLDRHAAAWVDARVAACEATHVRGDQSPELLDVRMRCLDRRRGELRALVDVLAAGDVGVVDHAIEATAQLGSLAECSDVAALARAVPLPDAIGARVAELDRRAAEVEARRATGRYLEALPLAEQLDKDAAAVDYAPIRARCAADHADTLRELGRNVDADPVWLIAVHQASAARDDRLALAAWRGLIDGRVFDSRLVGTDELAETAIAAAERLDKDDPARALLDESLAALRDRQGQLAKSLVHAKAARDWFAAHAPGTLDAAQALGAMASSEESSGDYKAALASNAAALAALTPMLGADHPRVATLHRNRARLLSMLSRFDDARAELTGLIAPIERAYGSDTVHRGELEWEIGELDRRTAHFDDAEAHYTRALAIFEKTGGDTEIAQALVGLGITATGAGKPTLARGYFERAKQAAERALPGSARVLSGILVFLGDALGNDDLAAAQRELERAREIRLRLYGPESSLVGQVENTLGTNYTWLGQHDKAEAYLRHAIAIEERSLGAGALDALYAHHNLGNDLLDQERYAEGLVEHERALAGLEKVLGKDHPVLTAPLSVMGYEYAVTGRPADGLAAAERAHAIRSARHEPDGSWIEFSWGVSMWVTGNDRTRGLALVRSAIAGWHRDPDDPATLRHAEAWLAAHR